MGAGLIHPHMSSYDKILHTCIIDCVGAYFKNSLTSYHAVKKNFIKSKR